MLIVYGGADPVFAPPDHALATAAQIPNADLWLVEGMGHMHADIWTELTQRISALTSLR